ncbi:ATP-grasp domain-containing protein [Streptomyces rochei]|uniref:ATP-grasp domain-containing protein n=1 Tax=Streptomyces rochei TaxID=1928 RepID=UPI003690B966
MSENRLVVVYDLSAAGPAEILAGLKGLGEVTFAVNPSDFTRRLLPLLRELAEVVMLGEPASRERLRSLQPSGILTLSDSMVLQTAALAADLGLTYHTPGTAELLTSKYAQRRRLWEDGVGRVRSCLLQSPLDWPRAFREVGLPAVLKPLRGQGSRNTYLIEDERQGRRTVEELLLDTSPGSVQETALVLETFLRGKDCDPFGDYVSVESIVSRGVVSHFAVTGKFPLAPPFREVGQFWPALLEPEEKDAVLDLTGRAIKSLGVACGILHTEIKRTEDGPEVIEVNGRLGGLIDRLCFTATGINLIQVVGRLALAEHVELPELPLKGVTFQHTTLPPTEGCRLEEIHGAREVRRMEGITTYRPLVAPGSEIDGGVGTHYLDYLCGTAADHTAMESRLHNALDQLSFTFTLQGGCTATTSARALTRMR